MSHSENEVRSIDNFSLFWSCTSLFTRLHGIEVYMHSSNVYPGRSHSRPYLPCIPEYWTQGLWEPQESTEATTAAKRINRKGASERPTGREELV